jgi:NAD(P)-dependent dehydrogenase (short-subunit alcohol dehydrogenase family)
MARDRVVIITGAGSEGGLGQAIARRLVTDGDRVAIVDRDVEGAERNAAALSSAGLAGDAVAFGCDVGERTSVMETARLVEDRLGRAWGLVNCAAGGPFAPAQDYDEATWRRGFDVTVNGALWWSQAVFPQMRDAGGGRIVNFGSEASDYPETSVGLNYTAAKGAVRSLTRGLALEWGEHGITVNTVWPVASTPPHKVWAEHNPDVAAGHLERTALHRFGDPFDDVAPVVKFLLSDDARFVTGTTVPCNGGRAMP